VKSKDINKVLVTGGAGFIGSHTVELLLDSGLDVRVLDNLSTGTLENLRLDHPMLEFVQGDIRDMDAVTSAMEGVTHCIHLAAQVSVVKSIDDPVGSGDCNVQGFLHVLEAARQNDVKKVVYASSAAVYGVPAYLPLDENAPTNPISPYGLEKLIDEQYANLYHELYGLSAVGLRYFNVYGPRQDPSSPYSGVISIFTTSIRSGTAINIFGDGQQTRDFIFVKDVAQVNMSALQCEQGAVHNVATGQSVSLTRLIDILKEIGGEVPVHYLPVRDGDIKDSSAHINTIKKDLNQEMFCDLRTGLKELLKYGV